MNVKRVADYKINKGKSKGKNMCFLTVEDESCSMDSVVVFPEARDKFKYIIYEGNNLVLCGSVKKNDNSFIVDSIYEI